MDVVGLHSVDLTDFSDSERAIFDVLRASLQYPAKSPTKSAKLADDIIFFCRAQDIALGGILWQVWSVLIDIIYFIPSGHSWQDDLIESLVILRRLADPIVDNGESALWKDLPYLSICVSENWNDPTETGEESRAEFTKWRNFNSFVARLTSVGFTPWLHLPIWQLRTALEEPALKGPATECRVWIAIEWVTYCGDVIFQNMRSREKLSETAVRSLRVGPLCEYIFPQSIERWEYWQSRFSKLSTDAGSIGLGSKITRRISDVLKRMDGISG